MSAAIASVLVVIGSAMTALAGIGIARLPDVFIRMHADRRLPAPDGAHRRAYDRPRSASERNRSVAG